MLVLQKCQRVCLAKTLTGGVPWCGDLFFQGREIVTIKLADVIGVRPVRPRAYRVLNLAVCRQRSHAWHRRTNALSVAKWLRKTKK